MGGDAILLRQYYEKLFPFKLLFAWLNYGYVVGKQFEQREFSFTLTGDIYQRFLCFSTAEAWKQEMLRLCPVKMDIGAVYNVKVAPLLL